MNFSIRQLLVFFVVLSVALTLPKFGAWFGIVLPLFVGSIVWGTLAGRRRRCFAWGGIIGITFAIAAATIYALVLDSESTPNTKQPLKIRPNPIGMYSVPLGLVVGGAIGLMIASRNENGDKLMTNPFESPTEKTIQKELRPKSPEKRYPPSKWFTIPVGAIAGGVLTAVVACVLAFIVLMPPLSRIFGLGGEFDGLLLIGLPIFALPGGVLGGLVFGCIWKWQRGRAIATICASLPAVAYFFAAAWQHEMSKNSRDQFVSTAVSAMCMAIAAAIGLRLLGRAFVSIERHRSARLYGPE